MVMKELQIIKIEHLDSLPLKDCGGYMEIHCRKQSIDCINWPQASDYQPLSAFSIAYSTRYLYIHFVVRGADLRATHAVNLSPVADDSCVEFFMKMADSSEYWNFEFNCIGTTNASHRTNRINPTRLNDSEIGSIKRFSSCGNAPFEEKSGIFTWTLTIAIPLSLVGLNGEVLPEFIMGNFYKCGGKTSHPHYLSWSPILSEKPNFHEPKYFGKLTFA